MNVFFYYELSGADGSRIQPVLLRCGKPAVSGASQTEQEVAELALEWSRHTLLHHALEETGYSRFRLVGCCELPPEGDELYAERGGFSLAFWYAESGYGRPWIVIAQAETAEEFFRIVEEDDDIRSMKPLSPPQKVTALFYTEQDLGGHGEDFWHKAIGSHDLLQASPQARMKYRLLSAVLEEGRFFDENEMTALLQSIRNVEDDSNHE
ncbi:hypothetical protein [Gorillibacterium sp. sgz5001074]|uniref:hypothetical protein n=1 Tax=Gorillibacterium sp. sgz5001074 TaxID=3446695 RepID=UPI003F674AE4